jgi:hypothetical protein
VPKEAGLLDQQAIEQPAPLPQADRRVRQALEIGLDIEFELVQPPRQFAPDEGLPMAIDADAGPLFEQLRPDPVRPLFQRRPGLGGRPLRRLAGRGRGQGAAGGVHRRD